MKLLSTVLSAIYRLYTRSPMWLATAACMATASANAEITIPNQPLTIQPAQAIPMIMLALGRDHRMFYEAYNDASDIDGDGTLDIRFKPSITYLGLFDSNLCYTHNGGNNNAGVFTPVSAAIGTLKTCAGGNAGTNNRWSGNWLNYVTTSRIDALRVVLYGGTRDVDSATQTVLRRAYIPQDAHSWAKEYTSLAIDGYQISDYTPLAQPNSNRRHFFGNLTPNASVNCSTLNNCSGLAPWLSVVTNSPLRVWEWASTERPVLSDANIGTGAARTNYTVRVQVCTTAYNAGCKLYPNGNYKPVGLLHDFGENDGAYFGLFSGSYDSHLSGGRLRKVMSSFKNEITPSTGIFTTVTGIVSNMNAFRLYGFNRGGTAQLYEGGVVGNRAINQGEFPDWGNPFGELLYEATRYIANKGSPTGAYINNSSGTAINTIDDSMGLSRPAWDRPYKQGSFISTAQAPWCARASILGISDTNISFDSDQLPGTNFGTGISTDLAGTNIVTGLNSDLNVSIIADLITANEPSVPGLKYIGESSGLIDNAPTPKSVTSLKSIRGLAPEEPTKRGSYYAASVAHFSKVNDLNSSLQGNQTIDNYFVALASPLPRIEAKLPNGRIISLVPFAKSVHGAFSITNTAASFQPSNQIVDFYVERIANSGAADADPSVNGGRYEAVFRINYEDVEQGNDHDMDAIVVYTIRARADNTLEVILQPTYQAGGVKHRMGYIVSGTTQDGTYLVVQDESDIVPYYLNVPPGRFPGYCAQAPLPGDCSRLPYLGGATNTGPATVSTGNATSAISQFVFTPSSTPAATFLKDPLWYASKWGGFAEANGNARPDVTPEWDADGDGVPDTYFFVQNPTKLKASLTKAFTAITERGSSSSNLASNNATSIDTNSFVYRASYVSSKWIGELEAFPITTAGLSNASQWRASEELPTWSNRRIFMHASDGTVVDTRSAGFSTLPTADQTSLVNADIYNYIRGDQTKELGSGTGILRKRDKILGDIIHSAPGYDEQSNTVYVGSNGGMLHAFDGSTGVEKFAFIPRQVVPRLKNLSSLTYASNHEYFVDGEILRGQRFDQTNLNAYVHVLLGRGGKGLFSIHPNLNAANTTTSTPPTLLWEYTPVANTQAASDADLGFMLSRPIMVVLNNDKAAVIVGNGYNSTDGKAVLYIFIINADGTLAGVKKLDTGIAGDNGLAGPTYFDNDSNGTADFIYAGDLKGNLWKFDISSINPDDWKVAYANQPLFKVTNSTGGPQPITAPSISEFNSYGTDANVNNLFVYVGSGSYFRAGDNTDLSLQTMYGIVDTLSAPVSTTVPARSNLRERTIASLGTISGRQVRYFSTEAANDMAGRLGWFIDLKNPAGLGERVFTSADIARTKRPGLVFTSSYPVNGDVCVAGGNSYLNVVNPFTGAAITLDAAGNGLLAGYGSASSVRLDGIATAPLVLGNLSRPEPLTAAQVNKFFGLSSGGACAGIQCREAAANLRGNSYRRPPNSTPPCINDARVVVGTDIRPEEQKLNDSCGSPLRGRISWREIIRD
jgi:type IV pilus assembly protein PilY1